MCKNCIFWLDCRWLDEHRNSASTNSGQHKARVEIGMGDKACIDWRKHRAASPALIGIFRPCRVCKNEVKQTPGKVPGRIVDVNSSRLSWHAIENRLTNAFSTAGSVSKLATESCMNSIGSVAMAWNSAVRLQASTSRASLSSIAVRTILSSAFCFTLSIQADLLCKGLMLVLLSSCASEKTSLRTFSNSPHANHGEISLLARAQHLRSLRSSATNSTSPPCAHDVILLMSSFTSIWRCLFESWDLKLDDVLVFLLLCPVRVCIL
mmetsp:Transcript_16977/g.33148  ORF Transcript_16977/g.33148 Transcript_16977/m.33148 type:complete len:265 (+) Transcript_16977:2128-2922(+)